jgi:hypothetical protein
LSSVVPGGFGQEGIADEGGCLHDPAVEAETDSYWHSALNILDAGLERILGLR